MSVKKDIYLVCDQCGAGRDYSFNSVEQAREQCSIEGWSKRGKEDICNECFAENHS